MYVYIAQTALHANIYCNQSLVLFKVSGKYWTIVEIYFKYPIAQSWWSCGWAAHLGAGSIRPPGCCTAPCHWHDMTILISSPAGQVFWAAAATTLVTGLCLAMLLFCPKQQYFHTCHLFCHLTGPFLVPEVKQALKTHPPLLLLLSKFLWVSQAPGEVLHPTVASGCHHLESSDLTGCWG